MMTEPLSDGSSPDNNDGVGHASEKAVRERYSAGAKAREEALCCPVDYDVSLLEAIPQEVIERDYGCGDPTKHLAAGERVLDLGSGTGKACFMASQVVGPEGSVLGIDMNDDMLEIAERNVAVVAGNIGHGNVSFGKGRIQDLSLDLRSTDRWLADHPVRSAEDLVALEDEMERQRHEEPLVPTASIDVVVSNCVLNLVKPSDKAEMFREIHRVLKPGGRAVISDIVCDELVPEHLQADPDLWSGCISGAFREDHFLEAFEKVGFHGIAILERQREPWQTVEGIEFRSLTVVAYRGEEGSELDRGHAVIYKGPFRAVEDDHGQVLARGARTAVSDLSFERFQGAAYAGHVETLAPRVAIPVEDAAEFSCGEQELRLRHPRETKGDDYSVTSGAESEASCCGPTDTSSTSSCC